MDRYTHRLKGVLWCLLAQVTAAACVQAQPAGQIISSDTYTYHAGDLADTAWAQPDYDDSGWVELPNGIFPYDAWPGIGLFRRVIEVDSTLWGVPMALSVRYMGALEYYLDGTLIHRFGVVGASKDTEVAGHELYPSPRPVVFPRPPEVTGSTSRHVVAVRYSRFMMEDPAWTGQQSSSFSSSFGFLVPTSEASRSAVRKSSIHQMLLTGVGLAVAFFHLILFLFHRAQRANLLFSGLAACGAMLAFYNFEIVLTTDPAYVIGLHRLHNVTSITMALIGLRLVYMLYLRRLPRAFWGFVVAGAALCLWTLFRPFLVRDAMSIFVLILLVEIARAIIQTRISEQKPLLEESWVLEIGLAIVWVAVVHDMFIELGVLPPLWDFIDFPTVHYATLGLLGSMSVMLGFDFGRTKQDLEAQLRQVQALSQKTLQQELERAALEAENRRKQLELDGARLLQLSMLPSALPDHPTVVLAASMHTATEVGGDYYDFEVAEDGTLTLAIGDAMGHGLEAGTMVTATKSLFNLLAGEHDLKQALRLASRALRRMNLPKLYMAMALARVRGHALELAGAGMPPALLYRAATGCIEQIALKGMPLGGLPNFPYHTTSVTLAPGDTLVLMSDGFPELFNGDREMLGYDEAVAHVAEAADGPAESLIRHLLDTALAWRNGHPQEDDMTFVVMKVKALEEQE